MASTVEGGDPAPAKGSWRGGVYGEEGRSCPCKRGIEGAGKGVRHLQGAWTNWEAINWIDLTVQPVQLHGSYGRDAATGRGTVFATRELLKASGQGSLKGKEYVIQVEEFWQC